MATKTRRLDTTELVLAALASANGKTFEPVHVQKLFFLIDARLSDQLGGKYFAFEPYDYGPFDKVVYDVLADLAKHGLVEIIGDTFSRSRCYVLTAIGLERGTQVLTTVSEPVRKGIETLAGFVLSLSFQQLVSAIYAEYPEMKVNSVFSA